MLREVMNRIYIYVLLGIIFGSSLFYLGDYIPSEYFDYFFYLFALQGLVASLVYIRSIGYLIFSIIHFSFFFWLLDWLIRKKLNLKQWILVVIGYMVFNITTLILSFYILTKHLSETLKQ